MQRFLLFCFAFIIITAAAIAQCPAGTNTEVYLDIPNPSFEGPSKASFPPAPYANCLGTADTQPGIFGVKVKPSDGNSYLAMVYAEKAFRESASVKLNTPMKKGVMYSFTIDLMQPDSLIDVGKITECNNLQIYGGTDYCMGEQLLWTSPKIEPNSGWDTYTVKFTPDADYTHVLLAPVSTCGAKMPTYLFVDNISRPNSWKAKAGSEPVTCNGMENGKASIISPLGDKYTYQWKSLPGPVNNGSGSAIKDLHPGKYVVIVTDKRGNVDCDTVEVKEPPAIDVALAKSNNVNCHGGSDGAASLSVSDATGPVSYSWKPGGATTAAIENVKAGSYTCTITYNNGCSFNKVIVITQPDSLFIAAITDKRICLGQTVSLVAAASGGAGSPYTYSWNNGASTSAIYNVSPTQTTSYTVIVKDKLGCESAPLIFKVTVNEKLKVVASADVLLCKGSSTTLTAVATGGDDVYSYKWLPAGTGISDKVKVAPISTTVYIVEVSDNCNSPVATDSVKVTVIDPPVVNLTADVTSGCSALCVNFSGTAKAQNDLITDWQWQWEFGNGKKVTGQQNQYYCYAYSGLYSVSLTATSLNGNCYNKVTQADLIKVYAKPTAGFYFQPWKTTLSLPKINFINTSKDAQSWYWNFADKNDILTNTSTLENPEHTYSDTGNYCVRLIAKNDKQCPDTLTRCLRIAPDVNIFVPNAFTPNSSGLNDYFKAKGMYIRDFEMDIYDRWGMLVFHSASIDKGWDGSVNNNGASVQEDVYVYKIRATDTESKHYNLMGTVTLIR